MQLGAMAAGDPNRERTHLTSLVQAAESQDQALADVVSTTGAGILEVALDMYAAKRRGTFDSATGESETEAHKRAIANLKDLERTAAALVDKTEAGAKSNMARVHDLALGWARGETINGIKSDSGSQPLHEAHSLCAAQGGAYIVKDGMRTWSEVVKGPRHHDSPSSGWKKLQADLHQTTAMLMAALIGPAITASINTLPQSVASAELSQTSHASVDGSSGSRGRVLLGLAASWGSNAQVHGASTSETTATYDASTTTADLPIVQSLLDMQDRIEQTRVYPASRMMLQGMKTVTETEQHKDHPWRYPDQSRTISVGQPVTSYRDLGLVEDVPAHLVIPESVV